MRAWLKVIGWGVVAIALALAALPLWVSPVLRAVGRPLHLRFGSYRMAGYSQFELRDVVYEHGPVRVTVGWARVDTPVLWAWRHWLRSEGTARARDWRVVVVRSTTPRTTKGPIGLAPLHDHLVKIASILRRWVPNAELDSGRVDWPNGGFSLASVDWNHGTLTTRGLKWLAGSADVRAEFPTSGPIRVDGNETDRAWRAQLLWPGATVAGTAWAWDQPLKIDARYDPQGWLPVHAEAHGSGWAVAAPQGVVGNSYSGFSGGCDALWDHGRYSLRVRAKAAPKSKELPPLDIDVAAAGDRWGWSVDALHVSAPYAQVALNRPVQFRYGQRLELDGAELRFALDLQGIERLRAAGKVAGAVKFLKSEARLPNVAIELDTQRAGWGRLPPADVHLDAQCDLQRQTVLQANVRGHWAAADLRAALPSTLIAQSVEVEAKASGPFQNLATHGTVRVNGFQLKPLLPGSADLTWDGVGAALSHYAFALQVGTSRIEGSGSADRQSLRLAELNFAPGGTLALQLARPATLEWGQEFQLPSVDLEGGGASVRLSESGSAVSLEAVRIPAAWISSVTPWGGPDFLAQSLKFAAHWDSGRLAFSLAAQADLWLSNGVARVIANADGQGKAVRIREIRIESGGQALALIHGRLPAWWQETAPHLQWDGDAPLEVRADTSADSPFWAALADSFGLALVNPQAFLTASGSLRAPQGKFHLQIASLEPLPGRASFKVPALRDLKVDLHADRHGLVLDDLSGQIAGRSVVGSGRLPLAENEWAHLFSHSSDRPWERAEGKLDLEDGDLQAFAAFLPPIVAPRGRLGAHFRIEHGSWDGAIRLQGLQLRPIAPIGLIQNITGDLECHGRAIDLTALTAEIGGQTARLSGRVDFPPQGAPQFVLGLQGNAIPLVRQANLLVRADLDLKASTIGRQTQVTGTVKVADGLMLGDLADLLPSGLEGGGRPPPYFSIETAPFSRWHCDVTILADHTLRAHTSLFTGQASTRFQVIGTLADPRAVGQLTINEGEILLPFATFDVQFGAIRLQPDDPFHPRVEVSATSRRYDYDLRMNVTGAADSPVLTFSSNPALPSDQILQLVMAGQMPQTNSLIAGNESQVAGLGEYLGQGLISGLSGGSGVSRLSISSGQELSINGRPTYQIEYRLGKRWWLTGEYDVFDDYNAGVKWRVFTKGGKP
ncbi:MAG TPA: translocation/assembly module TamB domain-containing protein [Opitutaceae bacterium]|jgi:translocation and assembly module TamB